jgi:hypothetical protein
MISTKPKSEIIKELYLNDKLSMAQIAIKLFMSPSSVRYWLDKEGIKRRNINEAINSWYTTKQNKKPFKLTQPLTDDLEDLKTAGVMLYWGEGAKSGNVVKFVNSDPEMIRTFLSFLRKVCGVQEDRLKALIHIYPDHNEAKLKLFWIRLTKIKKANFYKSFLHEGKTGTYKNKSKWGTITINYPDKLLLGLLLNWIDEYKKKY